MMDFLQAVILGIVEGITEFLPISSTGHLILAANFLGIPQTAFVKTFEVVIQLGAILAVVSYSFKYLSNLDLLRRLVVAFIPSAVTGVVFYQFIKNYLIGNPEIVLISLAAGGIALIGIELMLSRKKSGQLSIVNGQLSYERAFVIGLFQSFSIVPGVSRAASTIVGGMLVGLNRKAAVEFSFLLAIPTMIAAASLDLRQNSLNFSQNEWYLLVIGFVVSFIVALIVVRWLVGYVQKNNFIAFGVYRIALAILYYLFILK